MPAIAVADALRADGADIVFVGGRRAEAELVPAAGYELETLTVEGISRTNPLKAARAVARAGSALVAAQAILRRRRPDAILGGGGYVAGPVGLAGILRGIPLVLTEADSHLGLTNRALAGRARRVCLAFPLPGREGPRYVVTGRPVPPVTAERTTARERFGFAPEDRVVLVFGGSLGARSINLAAPVAFADAPYRVLHVAGRRDAELVRSPGDHYVLREYVSPLADALACADLAVARAGGSIFELAQYGVPAVLVPYPHASADHQSANARWMADAGAAIVVADSELTAPRLRAEVDALLGDAERLISMARASAAIARPDAARAVAGEVLAAARGEQLAGHASATG